MNTSPVLNDLAATVTVVCAIVLACAIILCTAFYRTILGPRDEERWFRRILFWFKKWWSVLIAVAIIIAAITLAIYFRRYWYVSLGLHLVINVASCSLIEIEKSWEARDYRWVFCQIFLYWPIFLIIYSVFLIPEEDDEDVELAF